LENGTVIKKVDKRELDLIFKKIAASKNKIENKGNLTSRIGKSP
jgi:hypothetical protein